MTRPLATLVTTGLFTFASYVFAATAQQLAPEAKFSVSYTGVIAAPVKAIAIGKDEEMTVSSAMMTAVNDAGSGLLHNLAGRCLMAVVIDKASKTVDQHGYCTYADADGDQISEKVDIDKQPLGAVIIGKGRWISGTGKYAGIEGAFEIRHSVIKSATDGVIQGLGKKIGSYKINKPM